ncbi:unnamed protein product [Toxocara canis]|uniref:Uncharacterized protein n=1 Tax=Toxocara canis TaxID=6265 RepID=A0A183URQ9_TOXCA|nr:unnamed protein product [Toxocara canis]
MNDLLDNNLAKWVSQAAAANSERKRQHMENIPNYDVHARSAVELQNVQDVNHKKRTDDRVSSTDSSDERIAVTVDPQPRELNATIEITLLGIVNTNAASRNEEESTQRCGNAPREFAHLDDMERVADRVETGRRIAYT